MSKITDEERSRLTNGDRALGERMRAAGEHIRLEARRAEQQKQQDYGLNSEQKASKKEQTLRV